MFLVCIGIYTYFQTGNKFSLLVYSFISLFPLLSIDYGDNCFLVFLGALLLLIFLFIPFLVQSSSSSSSSSASPSSLSFPLRVLSLLLGPFLLFPNLQGVPAISNRQYFVSISQFILISISLFHIYSPRFEFYYLINWSVFGMFLFSFLSSFPLFFFPFPFPFLASPFPSLPSFPFPFPLPLPLSFSFSPFSLLFPFLASLPSPFPSLSHFPSPRSSLH